MAVTPGGRPARTRYEVREAFSSPGRGVETALLEVALSTGRTHQIRVHLSAIGHPVVGDPAYGGVRRSLRLDRPFLHAFRLAFTHPVLGERIEVEEPLPPELDGVLRDLRDGGSRPRS